MEQTLQIIQTMVSLPSTLGSSFTTDTELKPRVSCANSRSRMGADRSTIGPLERWMGKRKSSWCSASLPFAMSWSSRLVTLVPSLLRCAASNSSVVATSTMITQAHISFTLWVAWLETVLCVCVFVQLYFIDACNTLELRTGIRHKRKSVPVASGNPGRYQCCDRLGTPVFHWKAYSFAWSLEQGHRGVQQDGQCEETPHWHRSQELDLQPAPWLNNFKLQFQAWWFCFLFFVGHWFDCPDVTESSLAQEVCATCSQPLWQLSPSAIRPCCSFKRYQNLNLLNSHWRVHSSQ